jgi:hypothetical protein
MTKPRMWPKAGDSPARRARQIAREYRDALAAVDPERCAVLDSAAEALGEGWVSPRPNLHTDGKHLSTRELAEVLGEKPGTVDQWWRRGHITKHEDGFLLEEVARELREWRTTRRQHADA